MDLKIGVLRSIDRDVFNIGILTGLPLHVWSTDDVMGHYRPFVFNSFPRRTWKPI